MPNNDYGKDIKVEISFNEMCRVIAKVMTEEPFDSLIEKEPFMLMFFSKFGAKITDKIFDDEIKKGSAENAD